ncbi:hypothetical protein FACS1894105_05120 [Clostridia bacterium]|nr:hypothetical protein FACS1894105_05120 [Clostridia bacterium]GHV10755.1 hypothetical protein FACS1894219_00780 [Clostridia bacterium]
MLYYLLFIVVNFVTGLLSVLQLCMFGRAIFSWFSPDEDNKIARFLFIVTEPLVSPIRTFLSRFEMFASVPIDMSFLFAMVILIVVTTFLQSVSVF